MKAKKIEFYVTSYCNFPHRLRTGAPVRHECRLIPPAALRAEIAGDYEKAIDILRGESRLEAK